MDMRSQSAARFLAVLVLGASLATAAGAADTASGSIDYKGRTAALKYAWLVTGPSDMEPGKQVRRLVLSATDIGGKLQACKTFSCTDGEVTEGMTVDFTGGPRLNYWVALNGQKVQYSGTARPETFTAKANDATHLAGQLAIDDVAAGGPKVGATFDVTLAKEFKVAR
jgi:hypothetical protein